MKTEIPLTPVEKELFGLLVRVADLYAPMVNPRVAGGWVRDKLLGKTAHDIDILLDNMTGPNFAKLVTKYLGNKDPHVIEENSEKSKHVETAKTYLTLPSGASLEVDFAMARIESYNEHSRTPENVRPATAEEDAERRDLTINALFYNLRTSEIEDFTRQGIKDLSDHILRSPGNPFVRFMEDPLRIFRVIRFATKLGWKIDPQTYEAMKHPKVTEALWTKIDPKRMQDEIIKTLEEDRAEYGLQLLKDTGIIEQMKERVFKGTEYEGKLSSWDMSQNNIRHELSLWEHTLQVCRNVLKITSPEQRASALLVALFHDMGKMYQGIQETTALGSTSYHGHEHHSKIMTELMMRFLRFDNKYISQISALVGHHMRPHHLIDGAGQKAIRRLLRDLVKDGVSWVDLLNQSEADALAKGHAPGEEELMYLASINRLREDLSRIENEMEESEQKIGKPILNGYEIMDAFNRKDPGPWIGNITQWLLDFQDGNPQVTKEEAISLARQQFPQFIKHTKTATIASDILLQKRQEQINASLKDKPYEAMSVALSLWKNYPDDDRLVSLCLTTAMKSKISSGRNFGTEDLYEAGRKLAANRIFNPEIICSFLGYKTMMGKNFDKDDIAALKRASVMNIRITKQISTLVESLPVAEKWKSLWKTVCQS